MSSGGLVSQPLGAQAGFNWVFLIELITCGILSLFFLFYFNRLFATVLFYGVRAYTWRKYKVYLDVKSLQISLLGGRVFFKSLRYSGHNETILIHDGRVTWRYWLRKVQEADVYRTVDARDQANGGSESDTGAEKEKPSTGPPSDPENARLRPKTDLPCRFHIRVSGVEAFIYNHSPTYDHILAEFEAAKLRKHDANKNTTSSFEETSGNDTTLEKSPTPETEAVGHEHSKTVPDASPALPPYLRLFPIQVECKSAAAAIGNENTTSVLVAKAQAANGRIDAAQAGSMDIFKLLFLFALDNVSISMRQNQDFKETQLAAASQSHDEAHIPSNARAASTQVLLEWWQTAKSVLVSAFKRHSSSSSIRTASTSNINLNGNHVRFQSSREWHGLERFLDNHDEHAASEWDDVEYARLSSLADFKGVEFSFFWDVPGSHEIATGDAGGIAYSAFGETGISPPDYGLEVTIRDGILNYGPWADRERIVLQSMFFPASLVDATPLQAVAAGAPRLATIFKMAYNVEGTLTLRIPMRESSKDYKWQSRESTGGPAHPATSRDFGHGTARPRHRRSPKHARETASSDKRPFGWMDITVFADSVVHYNMDMYARRDGFHNHLDVHLKRAQISTSVNHDIVWRSDDVHLSGDLSNPLAWNTLRTWKFDIDCHNLELFILRDHMFLLTDLVTDWTAGPPSNFFTFVPFRYELRAKFHDFGLFLGSNDGNLISRPVELDDNNFLILRGHMLSLDFIIPMENFRAPSNTFYFDVVAEHLSLDLSCPPRSTLHDLLVNKQLGHLPKLTLQASMTSHAETSPSLTDVLQMEICGSGLDFTVYGFVLRYFLNFKENYFGQSLHFQTFEEYQANGGDTTQAIDEERRKYKYRRSNDLDVILSIIVERPVLAFAANLYSADDYLRAEVPIAHVDLRVTNYYLDLQVDVSPLSVSHVISQGRKSSLQSTEQMRLTRAVVTGHRLFGLSPVEPAYVSTWDVSAGRIVGECSMTFLQMAAKVGQAFISSLDDLENALPKSGSLAIHDMMFLDLRTDTIELAIDVVGSTLSLGLDPIKLRFDDMASNGLSGALAAAIPNIVVSCVSQTPATSIRSRVVAEAKPECCFFLQTTLELDMVMRNRHSIEDRKRQQAFLRKHDMRTKRAVFLEAADCDNGPLDFEDIPLEDPAMTLPILPKPMAHNDRERHYDPQLDQSASIIALQDSVDRSDVLNSHLTSAYLAPQAPKTYDASLLEDVPVIADSIASGKQFLGPAEYDTLETYDDSGEEEQKTIMISFTSGIRALAKPSIVPVISHLVDNFIPCSTNDVMDSMQLTIIGATLDSLKSRMGMKASISVQVALPLIHLRTIFETGSEHGSQKPHRHQLEVTASRLLSTLRTREGYVDRPEIPTFSLHLDFEELKLQLWANDYLRRQGPSSASVELRDVIGWTVLSSLDSASLAIKLLTVYIDPKDAGDIALAAVHLADQVSTLQTSSSGLASKERSFEIIRYLSEHHSNGADPSYLSRMTYVLRAYPNHLRNQDSWKMIARVRHVLHTLDEDAQETLDNRLKSTLASTEQSLAPDKWLSWCAWDIPSPQDTLMFRYISGPVNVPLSSAMKKPMQAIFELNLARLLIGPPGKGSEISLADMRTDVHVKPPLEPEGLMLMEENLRTLIVITITTSAIFTRLKWDLVDIVGEVFSVCDHLDFKSKSSDSQPDAAKMSTSTEEPEARIDVHLVLNADSGTLILDTINLEHVSAVHNLNASCIATSRDNETNGSAVRLLLACDKATTELLAVNNMRRRIWRTDLVKPALHGHFIRGIKPAAVQLNIGGGYEQMVISVEQEPIGLIRIIDKIILDEVMHIKRLQELFPGTAQEKKRMSTSSGATTSAVDNLQVTVGLLMGVFDISIAVLKTLTINIRGKTGHMRIRPGREKHSVSTIDIDVGPVRYAAVSRESKLTGGQALFHTPAASTSAEVNLRRRSVKVSTTMQEMTVEASAIHNILTLIRRPEVVSAIEALKHDALDLQQRIDHLFGDSQPQAKSQDVQQVGPLTYKVEVTWEGVRVIATAPVKEDKAQATELTLGLGLLRVVIDNGYGSPTPPAHLPEITARFDSLYAHLGVVQADRKKKTCGRFEVALQGQSKAIARDSASYGDVTIVSDLLEIEVSADTAATAVDIITHIQKRIVDLDLTKEVNYVKKLRLSQARPVKQEEQRSEQTQEMTIESWTSMAPKNVIISLSHIRVAWVMTTSPNQPAMSKAEDLEISLARVEFLLRERNQAQLTIQSLQVQMTPKSLAKDQRSLNSALLPEMVFTVRFHTEPEGLALVFKAVGQAVDFQLDTEFVACLGLLIDSGTTAAQRYREASKKWQLSANSKQEAPAVQKKPFGAIHLASLVIDAGFAGGLLRLRGEVIPPVGQKDQRRRSSYLGIGENGTILKTQLRAPGVGLKLEYLSNRTPAEAPTLTAELRIDGSSNTVYPELVPIILQISDNAKGAMQSADAQEGAEQSQISPAKSTSKNNTLSLSEDSVLMSNELLARTKISLGLRILPQDFGLSCQPIAKVNAKAGIKGIYVNMTTLDARVSGRSVAVSAAIDGIQASVQHLYSRESTFNFDIANIDLSIMSNKRNPDAVSGVSAVLKIAPVSTSINARQLQDLLLFREIWFPRDLGTHGPTPLENPRSQQADEFLMQRYRQVAAVAAFPWNATVNLVGISVDIDFGQSIGRSSINVKNLWAASEKTSGWKQELCVGLENISAKSVGRMGGSIDIVDVQLRTLIEWPLTEEIEYDTPIIQASLSFASLKVKAAFDYQPFAFADLSSLTIIMFNVREPNKTSADRLVAALDLDHAYAYCTATSPAQAVGLFQAFDRLIQEKQAAFKQSVNEVQTQLRRQSVDAVYALQRLRPFMDGDRQKRPVLDVVRLRTDVVVRVQRINAGVFPSTFFDAQVLKLEAVEGQARFLVDAVDTQVHSNLSLVLGQLQVGLASVKKMQLPQTLADIETDEIIANGNATKGGIILRVPRLVASMQTWQLAQARIIDYVFKSTFEGKVDVGWNLARISYIRTMWNSHTRALGARLGKPLPESALKFTAGLEGGEQKDHGGRGSEDEQGKITAVVNVPASRYEYRALEPPIIETPQLRDMGEATPPLEWIGLQRDKLPHLIHQVVIVALLELAKEVEDAYGQILGSS